MKKILFLFVSLLVMSCSTSEPENPEDQPVKEAFLTIKSTETVEYKFQVMEAIPVEGGPQIIKQAEHFEVSELVYKDSAIYYLYKPEPGFTGTETVEITNYLHNGAEVYDQKTTKLTIEVRE